MNSRRNVGLVAAAATFLSAAPLTSIFEQWTWLFQVGITIALVTGAATLARALRAPLSAQVGAMAGTLLLVLTWLFPSGHEFIGVLPSGATFDRFGALLAQAMDDVRGYGIPVPDRPGLLFLAVAGVGSVGIVVDVLAVGLRRPALAGLPMLAIYSVPVAVHTDSVPAIPFGIGSLGFLWLLVTDNVDRVRRFGRRFTGEGRDVDLWEPSPLAAAGRRLAVVGVLAAVLVPLAIPGMTSGLLDNVGAGVGDDGTGDGSPRPGPGRVNLFAELSGRLTQNDTYDMVRVSTDDPDPYYLRFGVADQISPQGFGSANPRGRSLAAGLSGQETELRVAGIIDQRWSASVEVLNFDEPYLPVYGQPLTIRGLDSGWLYDSDRQVVYSNRSRSVKKKYQFTYVHRRYDPEALRTSKPLAPDDPNQRYANAPRVREISEWVQSRVVNKNTVYDKVRALYDSLSPERGFKYATTTKPGNSPSDIVNFLTNKQGFCEQYASALAWLVRAAGIPARVAFGFTRGAAPDNGVYTLTNRNLHAWTEVYFAGFGWVPFDATPAGDVSGSAPSAWAPDTRAQADVTPTAAAPNGPVETDDPRADQVGRDGAQEGGNAGTVGADRTPPWVWWTLAGLAVLLLLLASPALRRAALRRRRARAVRQPSATVLSGTGGRGGTGGAAVTVDDGGDRARREAHQAWDELVDTLIDYQFPVDPAETTRVTAERIARQAELDPPAVAAARLLGQAEEHARYARRAMRAEGLGEAVGTVRRSIATHVSRGTRIRAVLLPPSVLLRWRTAMGDAYARVVGVFIQGRDAASRLNPRRRLLAPRTSR
ncbi:transglutaminase family protein [Rhizomonospora bruguierae]|uniref:transglutaminase family protein n=1 Tax=Rhizomonospora bruguierae TaxID=1581705 RepID=UPI001BCF9818|nr:DUF3488 and transglutaminase-like domain-containing protein [Micromonospora sp. NBRC 107566]